MVLFLWVVTIPIGFVWFFADFILVRIVPEKDVALLGMYEFDRKPTSKEIIFIRDNVPYFVPPSRSEDLSSSIKRASLIQ